MCSQENRPPTETVFIFWYMYVYHFTWTVEERITILVTKHILYLIRSFLGINTMTWLYGNRTLVTEWLLKNPDKDNLHVLCTCSYWITFHQYLSIFFKTYDNFFRGCQNVLDKNKFFKQLNTCTLLCDFFFSQNL